MARWRAEPEAFRVDEVPLYAPSGEGGHTFVRVEKRGRTTEEIARALARAADVRPADVGYAGRKDRAAVATQWLSVPGLDPAAARRLPLRGARVLEAAPHGHKLRTGQLAGNRFTVHLDDLDDAAFAAAAERFDALCAGGLPNRFGTQRFGRRAANAERGARVLRGELRRLDRREARFLVSALQAAVFNTVLAERPLPLDALDRGDVAVVHASGGLFVVEDLARESARAARFEISATGPIFGSRAREPHGAPAERERAARAAWDVPDPVSPPRGIRLRGARRALRVRPEEVRLERTRGGARLAFRLPPGSYASVLVEELVGCARERPQETVPDDTPRRTGV